MNLEFHWREIVYLSGSHVNCLAPSTNAPYTFTCSNGCLPNCHTFLAEAHNNPNKLSHWARDPWLITNSVAHFFLTLWFLHTISVPNGFPHHYQYSAVVAAAEFERNRHSNMGFVINLTRRLKQLAIWLAYPPLSVVMLKWFSKLFGGKEKNKLMPSILIPTWLSSNKRESIGSSSIAWKSKRRCHLSSQLETHATNHELSIVYSKAAEFR